MREKLFIIMLCLVVSGCAFHFKNQKGVGAVGGNFEIRGGNVKDAKAHYYSEFEVWFPGKPKG